MQKTQRGTITDLSVVDGEPQLSKAVKGKKWHDTTRPTIPKLLGHDFALKKEQIEFMRILDEIWNGVIPLIEFERGLPTKVESEEVVSDDVAS